MRRIYLDTASTTPLDRKVRKQMAKVEKQIYGNPSSIHREGLTAQAIVKESRRDIARMLGAHEDELIFTSGGTESNNLALFGVARALITSGTIAKPGHIIVSAIEHQSVLAPVRALEQEGWTVDRCPVDGQGYLDVGAFKKLLRPDTCLVSVMMANNEIGTLQPIKAVAKAIRAHRKNEGHLYPYFHTDACQATRFYQLKVEELGVDLLTLNASKIYGPKGIGLLYLKRKTPLVPIIFGGGQERGLRSGTENLVAIVGLAAALRRCDEDRSKDTKLMLALREYFIGRVLQLSLEISVNGGMDERLPNNINIHIPRASSEQLVIGLDEKGVSCSTGSACSVHTKDESYVIMALGQTREVAESSIRFTLGRETRKRDLDYLIKILPAIVDRTRIAKL